MGIFGNKSKGTATAVMYSTWGRMNGDLQNKDIYGTFEKMTELTGLGYDMYSSQLAAVGQKPVLQAQVGQARLAVKKRLPGYHHRMYRAGDDNHPSVLGAYLDACVFLRALFATVPLPDWAPAGVSSDDAAMMRKIVNSMNQSSETSTMLI